MFANKPFYHSHIRRYVTVFGTLLNNIKIDRRNHLGQVEKEFIVPVAYGPGAKWIAKLNQQTDNNMQTPAIVLPRISFEIIDINYDGLRRLNSNENYRKSKDVYDFMTNNPPAPYNINITCTVLAKYAEDGAKIIEQILPYFKPEWTSHVKLIDDLDLIVDIPVILNQVSTQEVYEGQFEERKVIEWTLDFTMKAYFFGPTSTKKVIKFINLNFYPDLNQDVIGEERNITPGMTADRKPTTDKNKSVDWVTIEFEDPYDFVTEKISVEDKI